MRSSIPPILIPLILAAASSEGHAQTKPVITGTPVPTQAQRLNIEELEGNALINLDWTAIHDVTLAEYRWELTLDRPRDEQNRTVPILSLPDEPLCNGDCEGRSDSGLSYRIQIRPSEFIPSSTAADDARASVWLRVFRNGSFLSDESDTFEWRFEYDNRPPPPPNLVELVPGERRLTVRWSLPSSRGDDVETVTIGFCPDARSVTSSTSGALNALPCRPSQIEETGIRRTEDSFDIETDLQNGVPAAVSLRSTDQFGNEGDFGNVLFQTPREVTDFWELYRQQGGAEDGGFCFVATAAHGSYAHPVVRLLRVFRDRVLGSTPLLRGLTYGYYRVSPPLAARVAASEELGRATRIGLLPATAAAIGLLVLPGLGAMVLLVIAVRAFGRRCGRGGRAGWWAALLCFAAVALALGVARAERPESALDSFGLGFEFRGGPYLPSIGQGELAPGEPDAFVRIFGSQANPLYTLGAEVQLYRGFGTVGVGGSFGFMQWVGRAIVGDTGESAANDTTVFNLLPLTLTAVYRFDWLVDHTFIPLVPYVRGGLAYYIWWTTNGRGDVSRVPNDQGDDFIGRGGTFGVTGSLGIAFLLNVLEPRAARALFDATNIRGTYFFAEVTTTQVDGFGSDGFDLSDATWSLGLFLEL